MGYTDTIENHAGLMGSTDTIDNQAGNVMCSDNRYKFYYSFRLIQDSEQFSEPGATMIK